jgi:hypothetical protein
MNPFRSKRDKDTKRFYLLPGQGGDAYRRKQTLILKWSVIAALAFSSALVALMYWFNRPKF